MYDSDGYLTLRQLAEFLRQHGYPIGYGTIKKMVMPSRNTGPPHAGFWGQRKLFAPDVALAWARSRLSASPKNFNAEVQGDQDERSHPSINRGI
jgi:hypothetical protein